jgi:hypothetical protein
MPVEALDLAVGRTVTPSPITRAQSRCPAGGTAHHRGSLFRRRCQALPRSASKRIPLSGRRRRGVSPSCLSGRGGVAANHDAVEVVPDRASRPRAWVSCAQDGRRYRGPRARLRVSRERSRKSSPLRSKSASGWTRRGAARHTCRGCCWRRARSWAARPRPSTRHLREGPRRRASSFCALPGERGGRRVPSPSRARAELPDAAHELGVERDPRAEGEAAPADAAERRSGGRTLRRGAAAIRSATAIGFGQAERADEVSPA